MRTKTSVQALIRLLDDTDSMVVNHAYSTLLEYGEEIIPELEYMEEAYIVNPERREVVTNMLQAVRFQKTYKDLERWINSKGKNLLEAIYIINTYQFPELTIEEFTGQFNELKHRFWMNISPRQTCFEKISALNKVFFDEFKFERLEKSLYSPFEIYLNSVLDTKEGAELSLGLIYSIVAQSLDLPIYGVTTMNVRAPFVLAYMDETKLLPILNWGIDNNGVLCYIHFGMNGTIVAPNQLRESYTKVGLPEGRTQFEPSSNTTIVKKYLRDIRRSYANHPHYRYKLKDLDTLLELFQ